MGKGERAELSANDFRIESFETALGEPAIGLTMPGLARLDMSTGTAMNLACRLATAAVMGETYRITGESVAGPHDGQALAAIVGPALEILLAGRVAKPDEQKPHEQPPDTTS